MEMRSDGNRCSAGMLGLMDAMMFLVIMMVASSAIFVAVNTHIRQSPVFDERERIGTYVDDALDTILITTIHAASFVKDGQEKFLSDDSGAAIIAHYLELRSDTNNDLT